MNKHLLLSKLKNLGIFVVNSRGNVFDYGSGYGSGSGYGYGEGYGSGDGYGSGYGSGYDAGYAEGYGKLRNESMILENAND